MITARPAGDGVGIARALGRTAAGMLTRFSRGFRESLT